MNCPICGNKEETGRAFAFPGYQIYTCPQCLARFCHPFIDNRQVYKPAHIRERHRRTYLDASLFDFLPERIARHVRIKGKRILDVGCGYGRFLMELRDSNEVLGIEISPSFGEFLVERGIPHKIGDIKEMLLEIPDEYFDLITLWDVFEHLQDPVGLLASVKNKLAPGGIIIIWTNNYDDYISRFAECSYTLSLGTIRYFMAESFSRHLSHNFNFTPKTLNQIYEKLGFTVVDSLITDTASQRLTTSTLLTIALEIFYFVNRLAGKGKIICHVLKAQPASPPNQHR